MVAPVPAQISKFHPRLPAPPSASLRLTTHNPLPTYVYSEHRGVLRPQRSLCCPFSRLQTLNSFASYHIPATPAVSCDYALFCATARRYPLPFQELAHSFYHHRGVPSATSVLLTPRPLCCAFPSPRVLKPANSFVCIGLEPLCPLFLLFSTLVSFVFNRLQPLFRKHPGGGVSPCLKPPNLAGGKNGLLFSVCSVPLWPIRLSVFKRPASRLQNPLSLPQRLYREPIAPRISPRQHCQDAPNRFFGRCPSLLLGW